jgi:hypothetical protein
MKKTWIILASLLISAQAWAQSFTRTDFEQKEGQKLVRTTLIDVQNKTITLTQNLLNEQSGAIVWDKSVQWPVAYKKEGHLVGELDKKQTTALSLIFSDETLQQFASEFEVDEYLKRGYEEAKKEGRTKCADGFSNYKALAIETSKDFSEVFQAVCFK